MPKLIPSELNPAVFFSALKVCELSSENLLGSSLMT